MSKKTCLLVVLFTTTLDWVGMGLVYPLFSSLIFHADISLLSPTTSEATRGIIFGLIIAFASILEFIFAPILGVLSDNYGRKKVMVSSLACGVLGYCLSFVAILNQSIVLFFVSRLVVGIASSSAGVYSAAIADVSSFQEKAKHFGLYSMMCGIGFAIGPLLGGLLAGIPKGHCLPFLCAAFFTLCNMIVVSLYFAETHVQRQKVSIKQAYSFVSFKKLFAYPEFRALFIAVFLGGGGWSLYWEFMPVSRITQDGFTVRDLGNLYTYEAIFYVISCGFLIRAVVNRLGEERCFFLAMCCLAVFVAVLCIDKNPKMLWIYIPVQQFMLALFNTTATTLISNGAHHSVQGEVLGVQTSVQSLAFTLAPLIGGLFLSISINLPLMLGALSFVIGAVAVVLSIPQKIFSRYASQTDDT